jgi:hypothetical protein
MYFNLDSLKMRYEPYPIGLAQPLMDQNIYDQLVASFPPQELFLHMPKFGNKYTLSEKFKPENYHAYIRSQPAWREFHRWVKSDAFIPSVLEALKQRYIDLGLDGKPLQGLRRLRRLFPGNRKDIPLNARFEFSMLSAAGGYLLPHTDNANKIITLVISMARPGEWDEKIGGGTDVLHPKDVSHAFNHLNEQAQFSEFDLIDSYAFRPNQAILFIKTYNSWHSVSPIAGADPAVMRRTLTINIEKPKWAS